MNEKLLLIQKEIGTIKKDSKNPYFKSNYFDINAILAVVKPILNKHGIVLLQGLIALEGKLGLQTTLLEVATGDKVESTCPLPESAKPQEAGSAITYFRRYALQSLLALEAEDDDGNVSSGKTMTKRTVAEKKINDFADTHADPLSDDIL